MSVEIQSEAEVSRRQLEKPITSDANVAVSVFVLEASSMCANIASALLANAPPEVGLALVVVGSADDRACVEQIYAHGRSMIVEEALSGDCIQPNHIYLVSTVFSVQCSAGMIYLSPKAGLPDATSHSTSRLLELTARQRQILSKILDGESNKRIAFVLSISQRTVENHRAAIMRKLGARSLSELCRTCHRLGFEGC